MCELAIAEQSGGLAPEIIGPPEGAPLLPLIKKPDTVRDLGEVDIGPLVAIISKMSDNFWASENAAKENAYSVFHSTRHVVFRFPTTVHDPREFKSFASWRMLEKVLLPILHKAIAPYGFAQPIFPKAMLARVAAGKVVDEHRDRGRANVVTHKIHVPLQTSPGTTFDVGGETFHLARGRAYEVNNIRLHGVNNDGPLDRIHLIFEVFDGAVLERA